MESNGVYLKAIKQWSIPKWWSQIILLKRNNYLIIKLLLTLCTVGGTLVLSILYSIDYFCDIVCLDK